MSSPDTEKPARPGADERRITLSVPPDFFHTLADEFHSIIRLLSAGREVAEAANLARQQQSTPAEGGVADEPATGAKDRIDQLVLREHGRTIQWLRRQSPPELDIADPVDAKALEAAARTIPAHAADRLNRLFIAFDLIVGVPVRKELARRAIVQRADEES